MQPSAPGFFSIRPDLFHPFGFSAARAVIPFIREHQFNSQQQQSLQVDPSVRLVLSVGLLNVSDGTRIWAAQKSAILLTLEQLNNSITQEESRSVAAEPCSAKSTLKINNKQLNNNKKKYIKPYTAAQEQPPSEQAFCAGSFPPALTQKQ